MRDYYHHTRKILRVTERITQQFVSGHVTGKTRALFSFLPLTRGHKTPISESFFVRNKQLHPTQRDVFRNVGSTSGDKALGFHFNNGNWSFRCETQHIAVDLAIHIRVSSNQNRLVPKLVDNILG